MRFLGLRPSDGDAPPILKSRKGCEEQRREGGREGGREGRRVGRTSARKEAVSWSGSISSLASTSMESWAQRCANRQVDRDSSK